MTTDAIKAAQAELETVRKLADGYEKLLQSARKKEKAAHEKLHAARLERDEALPAAIVRRGKRRWLDEVEDVPVCIIKRTPKTIFVRCLGNDDETGDQYRLTKSGDWRAYPAPESWEPSRQLILKD